MLAHSEAAPEIVEYPESTAQQILPQIGRILIGKHHLAFLAGIHEWVIEEVGIVDRDQPLVVRDVDIGALLDGLDQDVVAADPLNREKIGVPVLVVFRNPPVVDQPRKYKLICEFRIVLREKLEVFVTPQKIEFLLAE